MTNASKIAMAIAALILTAQASAQITFYERDGYGGRTFSTQGTVANLDRFGFNDRASSALVERERWEVCEGAAFRGRCVVLRQGRYPSLAAMGLNDRISSARAVSRTASVDDTNYAPPPPAVYDDHRRRGERLYEAQVTSVRAVVGAAERRCWIEREQMNRERGDASVPGGIAGAVIGGILGHQVGGGTGRDLATVGGVVAGAAIGANLGRDGRGQQVAMHDIQRCANEPQSARPEYWDVTYTFRGQEHRMQMTTPPGSSVTVNRQGEPRT
jgi:uncharacterized protein YcfJ